MTSTELQKLVNPEPPKSGCVRIKLRHKPFLDHPCHQFRLIFFMLASTALSLHNHHRHKFIFQLFQNTFIPMCVAKATSSQSKATASLRMLPAKKVASVKASLSLKPRRKSSPSSLPLLAPRPKYNDPFQVLSGQSILVPRFKESSPSSIFVHEPTMYVPSPHSSCERLRDNENHYNFDAKPTSSSSIGFLTPAVSSSFITTKTPLAPKPRHETPEDYVVPSEILLPMLA